jgi:hypothetical protein
VLLKLRDAIGCCMVCQLGCSCSNSCI